MQLTQDDVIKFQKLYSKHFNTSLSSDDARQQLSLLVRQLEIVYQPITATQISALNNEDEELRNASKKTQTHMVEHG